MKRKSPMQMKHAAKSPAKMSEMEKYAKSRNAKPAPSPVMVQTLSDRPTYDPENDLHYLTRAAEIKAMPHRHRAAKQVAKKKMSALANISKA